MHLLRCLMLIFQKFLFKVLINLFIIIFLFYFCSLVASEVEEPPLVDNLNDKEYLKKNFLLLDNLFKKKLISNTNLFANEIKTVESFSDDILLKYIKKKLVYMSLLKDDQAILRRKEDDQAIVPIKIKSNISFWHNILQPLFFIRDLSKEAIDLLHLPTNQYDINNNPIILIDLIFHDLLDNFDIRFFLTIDRNLLFGFRKVIIDNYMRMNKKNKKREKLLKLLLLFPSDSKIPKKMLEDFSEGLAAYRYDIESKETCNYDMYQCIFFCLLRYLMRKNVHSGIKKIVTEELIKLMFIIQEWKSIDSNLIENYFDVFYDYNAREIELFFDELDKIKYRDLFFYSFKKIAIKILFTLSMVIINIILFSKFKSEDKRLRIIMFFLKVITLYIFINCIYSAINYCSSNASNYMYSKKKNVEFLKKFLEKMLNF